MIIHVSRYKAGYLLCALNNDNFCINNQLSVLALWTKCMETMKFAFPICNELTNFSPLMILETDWNLWRLCIPVVARCESDIWGVSARETFT